MRRSMLTAGAAVAGLTPVGATVPVNARDLFAATGMYCVWGGIPAAENGTVTNVAADFNTGGTAAFFTISSGNVIRAISANMAVTSGLNNYTVSLAIQTGDLIGVWCSGATPVVWVKAQSGVSAHRHEDTSTKPTAGNTRTPNETNSNASPALRGT